MAKQGKSRSGFMFGLVLGMAVGAAVALLFAPQPGEETRSQLSEGYQTLAGSLRERYGDAIAQGQEAYNQAKDEVLTRYNKAKTGA
jgi:gas vesicle protein